MSLPLTPSFVLIMCVASVASPCLAADTPKAPELPPRTGAEFSQDGIQVRLTVPRPQVFVGQPLALEIAFENNSKQDRTFLHAPSAAHRWEITATDAAGQVWQVIPPPLAASPPDVPGVIKAGEKQVVKVELGENYRLRRQGGALFTHLPSGKYKLSVKRTFHGATKNVQIAALPPLWVAEVKLDGVAFTAKFDDE